jgi:4-carboxymuconolactone decarboxylase
MKQPGVVLAALVLGAAPLHGQQAGGSAMATASDGTAIVITRSAAQSSRQGEAEHFTGSVRIDQQFQATAPGRASGAIVTFEPGARTAWHTHPLGQTLIVTSGVGRVQRWGDPVQEIRPGDVVWTPPGQKHWHGASPTTSMTHVGIVERLDGKSVDWMERVTDEQYNGAPERSEDARAPAPAQAEQRSSPSDQQGSTARASSALQRRLAPGLAVLTDEVLFGDVWRRPELSPRDRSLVTLSVLIATGKTAQLAGHLGRALDNGVEPSEASGLLAHLAIYCGWPSAVSALEVYDQVYTTRKVDTASLHELRPRLPASTGDASRAGAITDELGAVAPKFGQLTHDVVFDDLWRRPDLSRRDRSLATLSALAAMGDDDQLDGYLRGALENGLPRAEIAEAFTHLGFYAGWAKATRAMKAVVRSLGN